MENFDTSPWHSVPFSGEHTMVGTPDMDMAESGASFPS